jgi:hypothetical protein
MIKTITAVISFISGMFFLSFPQSADSLAQTAHIDDNGSFSCPGSAYSVAIGPDGTVFLANGQDGLRAYTIRRILGMEIRRVMSVWPCAWQLGRTGQSL